MMKSETETFNDLKFQEIDESTEQIISDEPVSNDNLNDDKEGRKYLLTEENFQLLKDIQQEIFEATDVSPGIRKLLNQLITEDRLNEIKNHFIGQFK